MDEMDYWRLCDELNVVQAALLIVGENPAGNPASEEPIHADSVERYAVDNRPVGYEAAKTALTHALISYAKYCEEVEQFNRMPPDEHTTSSWEALRPVKSHSLTGNYVPRYETDINGNPISPIAGSIELYQSTVHVPALKEWLRERGFASGFFFPREGEMPDYLDPRNPRYAPKLAAAVRAWEAVTEPGTKSPKKALDKWLREHAAEFGLADDEGLPKNQAVEDCSKVANWQPGGGAPKTPA